MNTRRTQTSAACSSIVRNEDSSKLVSLLALATGAVAMPQTGNADVIYVDMHDSPALVGWAGGYSDSFAFTNLQGTAEFGFRRGQAHASGPTYYGYGVFQADRRWVTAGSLSGGTSASVQANVAGFVAPQNADAPWNQAGVFTTYYAVVGSADRYSNFFTTQFNRNPFAGYDNLYLAWSFNDSTQGGLTLYGWVEISLLMADYPTGPNVTIWSYCYETTGAKLPMGALVPEPSSAGLLVLGALALGSRGLRSWRKNKTRTPEKA